MRWRNEVLRERRNDEYKNTKTIIVARFVDRRACPLSINIPSVYAHTLYETIFVVIMAPEF
jgi:hypothetical protein